MRYLLDTKVLSELRPRPGRHPGVLAWFSTVDEEDLFTSVIVLGEIRRGIKKLRNSDPSFAVRLEAWPTLAKDDASRALVTCGTTPAEHREIKHNHPHRADG